MSPKALHPACTKINMSHPRCTEKGATKKKQGKKKNVPCVQVTVVDPGAVPRCLFFLDRPPVAWTVVYPGPPDAGGPRLRAHVQPGPAGGHSVDIVQKGNQGFRSQLVCVWPVAPGAGQAHAGRASRGLPARPPRLAELKKNYVWHHPQTRARSKTSEQTGDTRLPRHAPQHGLATHSSKSTDPVDRDDGPWFDSKAAARK